MLANTDALGQTTQYRYNQGGYKEQQIDALNRVAKLGYTDEGRPNLRTLPLGQRLTSDYDLKGRQSATTDARGQYTTYLYDANDQLVQTNVYNQGWDLRDYDPQGRLIKTEQRPANSSLPSSISRYRYDHADRLIEALKPNGDRLNYQYDRNGNQTQLSVTPLNQATQTTSTAYDALGHKASEIKPNGVTTTYGYDLRHRLTFIRHSKGDLLLAQDRYTLDATGQRLGREHTDAQGQISVTTWDYDDAGRLIKETAPSRITAYELDAVGNVIRKTVNGTATVSVYDANDRLLSQTTNGVTTTYSHDAQGNTLTQSTAGQQKSFLYDGKNQLIAATVNGQSLSFGYDIEGIRSSKTVNGQTTRYLTDHNTPYARVVYESNGVTGTQYRYGLGQQLLSQNQAGQERFFLQDALGSTQALVDATGTLTDSYAYDAYGDIIAQSGSTSSAYRYAGEQYDQDLGLYYNRARYYDQGVGRFSQMDSYLGRDTAPITLNK